MHMIYYMKHCAICTTSYVFIGGRNKLKYCSKCGNELMDEAVICPKCGCPVPDSEMNVVQDDRKVRLKSASAMNAIAFILNILCGAYFAWALF